MLPMSLNPSTSSNSSLKSNSSKQVQQSHQPIRVAQPPPMSSQFSSQLPQSKKQHSFRPIANGTSAALTTTFPCSTAASCSAAAQLSTLAPSATKTNRPMATSSVPSLHKPVPLPAAGHNGKSIYSVSSSAIFRRTGSVDQRQFSYDGILDLARNQQRQIEANELELDERRRAVAAFDVVKQHGQGMAEQRDDAKNQMANLRAQIVRDEQEMTQLGAHQRDARQLSAHNQRQFHELQQLEFTYTQDDEQLRRAVGKVDTLRRQLDLLYQRRAAAANAAIAQQQRINEKGESCGACTETSSKTVADYVTAAAISATVARATISSNLQQRPRASVEPFQRYLGPSSSSSAEKDYGSPEGSKSNATAADQADCRDIVQRNPTAVNGVNFRPQFASAKNEAAECLDDGRWPSVSVYGRTITQLQADQISLARGNSLTAAKRRSWAADNANDENIWRYVLEEQRKGRSHISFADILAAKKSTPPSSSDASQTSEVQENASPTIPIKVHVLDSLDSAQKRIRSVPSPETSTKSPEKPLSTDQLDPPQNHFVTAARPDESTAIRVEVAAPIRPTTAGTSVTAVSESRTAAKVQKQLLEPAIGQASEAKMTTENMEKSQTASLGNIRASLALVARATGGSDNCEQFNRNFSSAETISKSKKMAEAPKAEIEEDLDDLPIEHAVIRKTETETRQPISSISDREEEDSKKEDETEKRENEVVDSGETDGRFGSRESMDDEETVALFDDDELEEPPQFLLLDDEEDEIGSHAVIGGDELGTDEASSTASTTDDPQLDEASFQPASGVKGILSARNELRNTADARPKRRVVFDQIVLFLDIAYEGQYDELVAMASRIDDISAANSEGITALHYAICAGNHDIVRFLIDAGADVNALDLDGWSPLHCAASCNNLVMLKQLVENGACPFATTLSKSETAAQLFDETHDFASGAEYMELVEESMGVVNDGRIYAAYTYDAERDDELSFAEGDELRLLCKAEYTEENLHDCAGAEEMILWWFCEHPDSGKRGFVPRNYFSLFPKRKFQKRYNVNIDLPPRTATTKRIQIADVNDDDNDEQSSFTALLNSAQAQDSTTTPAATNVRELSTYA